VSDGFPAEALRRVAGEGLRYVGAGGIAFVVDFAVYVALIRVGEVDYLVAAPIGFAAGLAAIYGLSVRWVFRERRVSDRRVEFTLFAAIGIAGMGLNQLIVYSGVEWVGLSFEAAKLASAMLMFCFNFGARKILLFSRP
jgi:putative flippase GtrA